MWPWGRSGVECGFEASIGGAAGGGRKLKIKMQKAKLQRKIQNEIQANFCFDGNYGFGCLASTHLALQLERSLVRESCR